MSDLTTKPSITLLVCTFNRSQQLKEVIKNALVQETDERFRYEILVVDNNSNDDTHAVVDAFIKNGNIDLHYLFEPRQGKSFALGSALEQIETDYYAIIDDDFILPPDYVKNLINGFIDHPQASYVGGKVIPKWEIDPPEWLTKEHWSAIAVADYGDKEFVADINNRVCLLACAFKTDVVRSVGGYNTDLGVNGEQIGGTEDAEISIRLWENGKTGAYLPRTWFHHIVKEIRCTKAYHRRWHIGHGKQNALMKDPEFENASFKLFGVPSHLYRQTGSHFIKWLKCILIRDNNKAFLHETHLRFFQGFFIQRFRDHS